MQSKLPMTNMGTVHE